MEVVRSGGMRIAVVGSGVAGLSAAWLLSKQHDVTVLEQASCIGGHTNTRTMMLEDSPVSADTGFIVYNEATYPNLTALFKHLGVSTHASNKSFPFSLDQGRYEYSRTGLRGVFGQAGNIVNMRHWQILKDIRRLRKPGQVKIRDSNGTCRHVGGCGQAGTILPRAGLVRNVPAPAAPIG